MGLCCCKRESLIEHDDHHDDKKSVLEPHGENVSASSIHPSLFSSNSIANPCRLTWLTDVHVNNVDSEDDEKKHTCRISGLCCLDNGRTVLLDRNNQTLTVFDPQFKYAYRQKIRKQLISLTSFEFDDIAILETGFIGLYNISGKYVTRLPKRFAVCKSSRTVAFNGTWFAVLYVQDGKDFVKIYSKIGNEYVNIPLNVQFDRKKYRSNNIELDRTNDFLYIPNMSEKCITCVNFHGEVVWNSVTVDYILHPSCLKLEGNFIFCCDWLTKGVNLVSLDGKRSSSICIDGVRKARFIAFQRKKSHLMIFTDFKYKLRIFDVLLPPEES
ncbi:uncharacterized protein LOC133181316 [Saccostrea echinata]|uniref:uncharacterized protein LOC133181316 n=1 Tax=Saccostrea echinata TaxID=191078 RepID=UPI002A801A1D|nr:uncharacterized protein LOC133181316 [Saccostrea echinata]